MLRNYLRTAVRNLLRHRTHFLINMTGLVIGLSAFLLIWLVLQYEQSFDNFHPYKNDIYRVIRIGKDRTDRDYRTGVQFPVTKTLRKELPQLRNITAIFGLGDVTVHVTGSKGEPEKKFREHKGVFVAEPQFFSMFNFPLVSGKAEALNQPNTALLTKTMATRYFGEWTGAIGRAIIIDGMNIRIVGVLDNPPDNTDFPLGLVISYITMGENNDWGSIADNNQCYIQLPPGASPATIDAQLPAFMKRHMRPENLSDWTFGLQPLAEVHYDSRLGNFNNRTFSRDLITTLNLIGTFLLLIACVNFINLSTAQAVNRAREVGVRKVLGGSRRQLLLQFMGETGITCLAALVVALVAVILVLPAVNQLLDIHLTAGVLGQTSKLLFLAGVGLATTLLAGFYPALVLSGFNPIQALRSKMAAGSVKGISLRRGLVVLQFLIAQGLIMATLVVLTQTNYFRNADMGFHKALIVNAEFPDDSLSKTHIDLLRNQLLGMPGVKKVSFGSGGPAGAAWFTGFQFAANHTQKVDLVVGAKPADTGYFGLYHLELAAGRVYFPSDTEREFMVNETLLRQAHLGSPQEAIGKEIRMDGKIGPIVGVVKDYHNNSLRDPINAMVFSTMKWAYGTANVEIAAGQENAVLSGMQNVWNKDFPDAVFEYRFVDQMIADFYKQENQLSQLYWIFAAIAIFISCLGLYGLISFMALQRKKEIGVRKVLGAPVKHIVYLLSREFTLLILLAFVIAAPIAWWFMHHWLQQYAYRIDIGAGIFILTIAASLTIAWLSVGYTALRAARARPAESLRTAE
jgi:putative ABC transport system permease protein